MKSAYFDYDSRAIVNLDDQLGRVVISRVCTPQRSRGQGIMRKLVEECLNDADTEGVTLSLLINAYGPMSHDQLEAWYFRLGFVWDSEAGWYIRLPKINI